MKLTEKQYFQLKSPRSLRWSSTVFGAACIVIGLPLCLFLGGLFFLIIGILILAIRKWGLSLAGTIGMFLLFAILLCFSIAEFHTSFQNRQEEEARQEYLQAIEQEQEKIETVSSTSGASNSSIASEAENLTAADAADAGTDGHSSLSVGILFALCAVVSLGAAILGCMATNDLNKCHKLYLLELEKELGENV